MTDYRPQRPAYSLNSGLWTYQDIVEHVLDVYDVMEPRRDLRHMRFAKRAILGAYRDLPGKHRWSCYEDRKIFSTSASDSTGTLTFDFTGGAYERMVTVAGTTVTSAIRFSRVIIDGVHYPIDEYKTPTIFTLPENENPGADVAAGASCTLYRPAYPLPVDFCRMLGLYEVGGKSEIEIVPADEVHNYGVFFGTPGSPTIASIQSSGEYYGVLQLVFGPPPSSADTYDMSYERYPRPMLTEKLCTGLVTTTGTTVVCTTSVFDSTKHVGSVIRFSSDGNYEPTSLVGDLEGNDNPYAAQRIIQSVTNATTVVIDTALTTNLTSVKYVLSDPLDLETGSMLTYFQRLCEEWFARLSNREDRHERRAVADRELLLAMEADSRVRSTARASGAFPATPFHMRAWSTVGEEIVN